MGTRHLRLLLAVGLLTGIVAALPAEADDWPQNRKDAARTAASLDRVPAPLTSLWSIPSGSILSWNNQVAWHGRVFFLSSVSPPWSLNCADARTGVMLWRQSLDLSSYHPGVFGPWVTQAGRVIVIDDGRREIGPRDPEVYLAIKTYDSASGRLLNVSPLATVDNGPYPYLHLVDQLPGFFATAERDKSFWPAEGLSEPAIAGDGFTALSLFYDWVVQWQPNALRHLTRVRHFEPVPESLDPSHGDSIPELHQLAIGEDGMFAVTNPRTVHPYLAVLGADLTPRWHRDGLTSSHLVADHGQVIAGTEGIVSFDAGTGAVRWVYPDLRALHTGERRNDLVVADGVVYGSVSLGYAQSYVVALDEATGRLLWKTEIFWNMVSESLVASADTLFAFGEDRMFALRRKDGKTLWTQGLPQKSFQGRIIIGRGLVFSSREGKLTGWAPAERTFRVATDSGRAEDYRVKELEGDPREGAANNAGQDPATDGDAKETAKKELVTPREVADASLLQLHWDEPEPELLRKIKERLAVFKDAPVRLTLVLDWLDPTRSHLRGEKEGVGWKGDQIDAFAQLCGKLAASAQPEHFDIAPDVNVYLTRHPEQAEVVHQLVVAARQAIKATSSGTHVLASFNAEVLQHMYGNGATLPFGKWKLGPVPEVPAGTPLVPDLDELGVTTAPQSGFTDPQAIPGDYLLAFRTLAGERPLLITRIASYRTSDNDRGDLEQALFLKRTEQLVYWLDTKLVAYPTLDELPGDPAGPNAAVRGEKKPRPSLKVLKELLQWKKVDKLTATEAK